MRIAIITDLHFGVRNNSQFFLEKQEQFFYEFFFPYLKNNNIKTLWMLGDFFENRKQISTIILNRAFHFLKTLKDEDIDCTFLIGNHDTIYKNTTALESLSPITNAFDNIDLIRSYSVKKFDNLDVGFVSWIAPDNYNQIIKWMQNLNANILCGHFEIESFPILPYVNCEKGIKPSFFKHFDKVLSGHFHLRNNKSNIHYIGNPYETNWTDYKKEKGFAVLDTTTLDIEYVNNPYSIYTIINYNEYVSYSFDNYKNQIVKVNVKDYNNKQQLEVFLEQLNEVANFVVVIDDNSIIIEEDEIETNNTLELINQYISNVKNDNLDKEMIVTLITEIYQESIEENKRNVDIL